MNKSSLIDSAPQQLWESIPEDVRAKYEQMGLCCRVNFSPGDAICAPQTASPGLYLLLSGKAVAYTSDPHRQVILRTFNVGAVFGVSDWYGDTGDILSRIQAATACCALLIRSEAMRLLLEECPSFRQAYIRFLTGRISFLNRKILYLTAGSAECKLSRYLLSLGEQDEVQLDMSVSALSEMLDLGRASLYRAFDTLIQDGLIEKKGKKIKLLNRLQMREQYLNETKNNQT